MPSAFLAWTLGCLMVYGGLFGVGALLYGRTAIATFWLATFAITGLWLMKIVRTLWAAPVET
jgi:hypothetical protein